MRRLACPISHVLITSILHRAAAQAPKLAPAAAAGDPFVDETASTIAKCKRDLTIWERAADFVSRAVTGKKTTTAAAAAACPLPAAKGTTAAKVCCHQRIKCR